MPFKLFYPVLKLILFGAVSKLLTCHRNHLISYPLHTCKIASSTFAKNGAYQILWLVFCFPHHISWRCPQQIGSTPATSGENASPQLTITFARLQLILSGRTRELGFRFCLSFSLRFPLFCPTFLAPSLPPSLTHTPTHSLSSLFPRILSSSILSGFFFDFSLRDSHFHSLSIYFSLSLSVTF